MTTSVPTAVSARLAHGGERRKTEDGRLRIEARSLPAAVTRAMARTKGTDTMPEGSISDVGC